MEKTKNKNTAFQVIQAVMISLAVIAIVFVVAIKIIGQQIANESPGTQSYNGLVSLRTEIINSITWVGIAVVVVIGFALIRMMTGKN